MKEYAERYAERMKRIGTESAFEVLGMARALERKGKKIVHLEIGEPDFDTPKNIRDAAKKALDDGFTHYTPIPGLYELREAIAEHVSKHTKADVKPEETIVTPGGKPALFEAIFAFVQPGDEVILPNPTYPIYESVVDTLGAKNVFVQLKEENEFRMTAEDVAALVTPKTKMIVVNSPHNPCGSALEKKDVEGISEIARQKDLIVVSDEIYSRMTYEKPHHSFLSEPGMKERLVMCDGFSKTYAMTGWRVGYAVAPKDVIEKMAVIGNNIYSCVTAFAQKACVEALRGPQDEVDKMVAEYDRRRKVIHKELNAIPGVECVLPGGAFYAFPNFSSLGKKSKELMELFLNEAGVACLHGDAFGKYGEGFMRFSYATNVETIQKGMALVKETVEKL